MFERVREFSLSSTRVEAENKMPFIIRFPGFLARSENNGQAFCKIIGCTWRGLMSVYFINVGSVRSKCLAGFLNCSVSIDQV